MKFTRLAALMAVAWVLLGGGPLTAVHAADDDLGLGLGDDVDSPAKIKEQQAHCLSCHSYAGLHNPPRQDLPFERLALLQVDPDKFAQSTHGDMSCLECHGESFANVPHALDARKKIKTCTDCHASTAKKILPEFVESVHYKKNQNFRCANCHNAHTMRKAAKMTPAETVELANGWCLRCHTNDLRFLAVSRDPRPDLDKAHSWLPSRDLHWKAVRCVDCHTPPPGPTEVISHKILPKAQAERNCVDCHSANSILQSRLYRHLVTEERVNERGFLNAYILPNAYVVGVTRNLWLDWGVGGVLGLTLFALFAHALARVGARVRNHGRH